MHKRIRFVDQWTLNTRSDHDTLVVHVQIRGRRRRSQWRDLLLVTCNMGGRFDHNDLGARLLAKLAQRWPGIPAVVGLQEGGDQPLVRHVADQWGHTYVAGTGLVGQRSTPMLCSPGIDVRRVRWQQLLRRVFVGPGAGPDWSKPKWWTRTRLAVDGVRFGASSWHLLASQQRRRRLVLAMLQARPVVAALRHFRRPYFVLGDLNSDQDQPLSKWLRRHGVTSNHDELGEVATHGRRSIDAVVCARRLVQRSRDGR